jgi:hypothetical protein
LLRASSNGVDTGVVAGQAQLMSSSPSRGAAAASRTGAGLAPDADAAGADAAPTAARSRCRAWLERPRLDARRRHRPRRRGRRIDARRDDADHLPDLDQVRIA